MDFDGYITGLNIRQDGTPLIVYNNVDKNEGVFYHVCSISDGKLETERNITELVYNNEININSLFLDDKNNLVATTENELKVYDADNKEIVSKQFGDVWITSSGKSASGDILVNLQSYNEAVMEGCSKLCVFDKDTYEMKNEIDMERFDQAFKGDYTIKRYPSKDNKGSYIYLSYDAMGICAKSENKDAAWKFVKRYLTEDYQGKKYPDLYCCPTRQDVFDVYLESKKSN